MNHRSSVAKILSTATAITSISSSMLLTVSCAFAREYKSDEPGPGPGFLNNVAHISISQNSEAFDENLNDTLLMNWSEYGYIINDDLGMTSPQAFFHNDWQYDTWNYDASDYSYLKHQNKYHRVPIKHIFTNTNEKWQEHPELNFHTTAWSRRRAGGGDFDNAQASLTDDGLNFVYNEIQKGTTQKADAIYETAGIDKNTHIFPNDYMDLVVDSLSNSDGQHGVPYGSEGVGLFTNQRTVDTFNEFSSKGQFDNLIFGSEIYSEIKNTVGLSFESLVDYILVNGWSFNQMIEFVESMQRLDPLLINGFHSSNYDTLYAINAKRYFGSTEIFNGLTDRNSNLVENISINNNVTNDELKELVEKNIEIFFSERYQESYGLIDEFVFSGSYVEERDTNAVLANIKKLPLPLFTNNGDQLFNDIVIVPKQNMFWFNDRDQQIWDRSTLSQTNMLQTLIDPSASQMSELPSYLSPYSSLDYVNDFKSVSKDREQLADILIGNNNFSYSLPDDFAIWYENIRSQYIIDWMEGDHYGIRDTLFNSSSNTLNSLIDSVNYEVIK